MRLALIVTALLTLCNAITLRSATVMQPLYWLPLLVGYAGLCSFALLQWKRNHSLGSRLAVRAGDISIGVVLGLGLLAMSWLIKTRLIPTDSERAAWLFQLQALLGSLQATLPPVAVLFSMALMEEIVWRGLVARSLEEQLGLRRAFPLATLLYAASLLPTVWTLADPMAGPNPLLLLAALGAGVVWTFVALRTRRLVCVMVSHAVFSYFVTSPLGLGQLLSA